MSTENAANTPVQAQVTEHVIEELKQDFIDNPSISYRVYRRVASRVHKNPLGTKPSRC